MSGDMRGAALALLLIALLFSAAASADTYDTHALVAVTASGAVEVQLLRDRRVDIVGRRGDAYRALLTPGQLRDLTDLGLKIEVLHAEMEEDRRLWREADEAAARLAPNFYYTASKFNTTNPAANTLMKHLLDLYIAHPDICRLYDIGDSFSGNYDILAIKVTKNPDAVEAEPKVRIYGNIHGDEKGGLMVACEALDWILANYPTDASARKLVDESEMWFIPMGNPDGNASSSRFNGNGVDLNRNFDGPDGHDDGSAPFSEPETAAIRDLTEVMGKRFTTGLSFHGGEICFNSLWNYTYTAPADEPIFWSSRTPGSGCSSENGCLTLAPDGLAKAYEEGCTTSGFWFTNGADWYQTRGDTNDWSYSAWSALDTTLEATYAKTPPTSQIPAFCAEHRQAVINYMLKTFQGISGIMADRSSGAPLDGTVWVTCTASSTVPVPYDYRAVYTDPSAGDFHRVLQPGTYTVTCRAPGYQDTVVPGVVVTADATTVVNCDMAGPCANNPSTVDVGPDGPLIRCTGTQQTLTCGVTGGSEVTYQWYDGVNPIPGATSAMYSADGSGTRTYNCRVTGSGCASGVLDAMPTQITWQTIPAFGGLTSVTNPQSATCSLDLSWSAGSGVCSGILTYKVYRSTGSPVSPTPENLLVSGVAGTAYSDSADLVSGTTYHYLVRAVDGAGQEDANTQERSGAPTGAGGGPFTLVDENFESSWGPYGNNPPTGWTIEDHGSQNPKVWDTNDWYRFSKGGSYGFIARVNYSPVESQDEWLLTPPFNLPGGATSAVLEFDHYFYVYSTPDEFGYVDFMSDQTPAWTNLTTYVATTGSTSTYAHASFSLLPYAGQTNSKVRFRYVGQDDWYWEVDNVKVRGVVNNPCTTGVPTPGETAPGATLTNALRWAGESALAWPANSQATGYKVVRGTPGQLPDLLTANDDSCIRWTGPDTTIAAGEVPPSGSLFWYLVVGTNAAGDGHPGYATEGPRLCTATGGCP